MDELDCWWKFKLKELLPPMCWSSALYIQYILLILLIIQHALEVSILQLHQKDDILRIPNTEKSKFLLQRNCSRTSFHKQHFQNEKVVLLFSSILAKLVLNLPRSSHFFYCTYINVTIWKHLKYFAHLCCWTVECLQHIIRSHCLKPLTKLKELEVYY